MTIGTRIKARRKELGISAEALAEKVNVSPATIYRYESGDIRSVKLSVLRPIARALGLDLYALLEEERPLPGNLIPASQLKMRRVPVLGAVAAGTPIRADREYGEYVELPEEAAGRYDVALRVEGDSMEPMYLDGDLVLIRCQDDVDDGQVAAICVDDTVTLKHIYHIEGGVQLISENPKYAPMIFTSQNANNVHLVGRAVGFMRWER